MAFVGLGRCGSGYEPGIEVQVALQAAPSTLAFQTDLGFEIRLEEAVLSIASLELIPCAAGTQVTFLERLLPRGPSTAWAHIDEQPTASDAVLPLDALHSGGLAVVAAILRPPPGRYCELRVSLAANDVPAAPPPSSTAEEAPANGLRMRGTARRDGSDYAFSVDAGADRSVRAPLSEVLDLSADRLNGAITLFVDQRRWLDGIDFAHATDRDRHARVVDNVLSGLTVRSGPAR